MKQKQKSLSSSTTPPELLVKHDTNIKMNYNWISIASFGLAIYIIITCIYIRMESDNMTQVLITQLELGGPKAVVRHKNYDWLLQLLYAKQSVSCHTIIFCIWCLCKNFCAAITFQFLSLFVKFCDTLKRLVYAETCICSCSWSLCLTGHSNYGNYFILWGMTFT